MNHVESHHTTEHAPAIPGLPFTVTEVQEFHDQDFGAGAAVCGLMLGIFCTGIVIYTIVLFSVL